MTHGEMERLLRRTGFAVEPTYDATAKMLPMLWAFSVLGRLP